jgi:hypothetical protein
MLGERELRATAGEGWGGGGLLSLPASLADTQG